MALPVIDITNFTGWTKIAGNQFRDDKLTEYITLFKEEYLRKILGDSAFLDILNTAKTKWTDLLNGVDYVDIDGDNRRNDGLVDQIVKFIYFEFIRDNFSSSQVGKVKAVNENSTILNGDEVGALVRSRYNSGVRVLHGSLFDFLENYETIIEPITGFVDNADNTYTINVASTLYLDNGDEVNIGGTDFVISGLIVDTSFVITAGSIGLSFSGNAIWEPYELVEYDRLLFSTI